jgi:hypothetical protein
MIIIINLKWLLFFYVILHWIQISI